jgi:hypothetical protein
MSHRNPVGLLHSLHLRPDANHRPLHGGRDVPANGSSSSRTGQDWSERRDGSQPARRSWRLGDFAQRNWFRWKDDDTNTPLTRRPFSSRATPANCGTMKLLKRRPRPSARATSTTGRAIRACQLPRMCSHYPLPLRPSALRGCCSCRIGSPKLAPITGRTWLLSKPQWMMGRTRPMRLKWPA